MESFEKSLKKLNSIVDELEEGNLSLDKSIEKFEEGTRLIKDCYKRLEEVKKKVEIIVNESEDGITFEQFQYEDEQ